jgi:hypothetical protein
MDDIDPQVLVRVVEKGWEMIEIDGKSNPMNSLYILFNFFSNFGLVFQKSWNYLKK